MKRKSRLAMGARSRKISRLVRQKPFGDFDKDGVPNIFDCEPANPKKHGVEPSETTWERLKALPIYVEDTAGKKVHVSDERSRSVAPVARKRFLSLLHKNPEILNELETSAPEQIIYTSLRLSREPHPTVHQWLKSGMGGFVYPTDYDPKAGTLTVSLFSHPFAKKPSKKWGEPQREQAIHSTFHELAHIKQLRKWGDKPALLERMFAGKYKVKPAEVKARAEEKRKTSYPKDVIFTEPSGEPAGEFAQKKVWSRAGAVMKGEIPEKRQGELS